MAAIERRLSASRLVQAAVGVLFPFVVALPIRADRAADVRAQVSYIGTALSSGNAADAMTPFDKSFPNYEKLSNYFQGLNAFQLDSDIEFVEEHDTETDAKLIVNWTLTLTDLGSDATEQRTGDINVELARKHGKWKIVEFSPIGLFDPEQKPEPKR
jgi:hypothetical protein